MSLFRSAPMKFYTIHFPREKNFEIIEKLGEDNFVQFVDSNENANIKPYNIDIRKCEGILNKLEKMFEKVKTEKLEIPEHPSIEKVLEEHKNYIRTHKIDSLSFYEEISNEIEEKYNKIENVSKNTSQIKEKIEDLERHKQFLFQAMAAFNDANNTFQSDEILNFSDEVVFANVCGIIKSTEIEKFSRVLFRITRGNYHFCSFPIPRVFDWNKYMKEIEVAHINFEDPVLKRIWYIEEFFESEESAFFLMLEKSSNMLNKINKICQNYSVKQYKIPSTKNEIINEIKEICSNLLNSKTFLLLPEKTEKEILEGLFESHCFETPLFYVYKIIIERQLTILKNASLFQESGLISVASAWVLSDKIGLFYSLLPSYVHIQEVIPTKFPPTYFETNEFTEPFQEIVDTYGIPRYQEINPALFAIPIFPFLFGVMFGDIGHGAALILFAMVFIKKKELKKEYFKIYSLRYFILMLGIFSCFCGFIYNEMFALPLNIFGSCYNEMDTEGNAIKTENCVYSFGFDPKWFRTSNYLSFFNSYKMKFATVIGLCLKMINSYYFKKYRDLFFEALPQLLFFLSIFGYMAILIISKWTIHWGIDAPISEAPSIISLMISFSLKMGSTDGKPLWDMEFQENLQQFLLIISLICIPIMLISKPFFIWKEASSLKEKRNSDSENVIYDSYEQEMQINLTESLIPLENYHEPHNNMEMLEIKLNNNKHVDVEIEEVIIYQLIETIEFVLGSISNTASYLRLWALSLAHAEMSKLIFEACFKFIGDKLFNPILFMIMPFNYFHFTLLIIMGMGSLECLLHALRLQWMEFQGKFYKADGWKFEPVCFRKGFCSEWMEIKIEE